MARTRTRGELNGALQVVWPRIDAVRERIGTMEAWLAEQGVDVKEEQSHLDEGSRERLYWHYGYLIGMRDAIKKLTEPT